MIKDDTPNNLEAAIRAGMNLLELNLRTVHPCKVRKVNDDGSVDVDFMIHAVDNDNQSRALPSATELPVLHQGNAIYTVTFPVSVGDEGLALFAERDISLFKDDGKTGPPNTHRFHDLSDGLFMPTPLSKPKRLAVRPGVLLMSNNGTEIEITDGLIRFNGDVEINGKTTAKGDIESTGEVKAEGEVTAMSTSTSIELSAHSHLYAPGPGTPTDTAPPTPG